MTGFGDERIAMKSFCIICTRDPNRYLQQTAALLRARRERPRGRPTAQHRDETRGASFYHLVGAGEERCR
jgi:hypothetical protein